MTLRVKMIVEKTKIKLSLYELYKIMAESDPIKGVFRQYDCVKLYGFPPETIWAYSWKFDSYEPILRFIKKKTLEDNGINSLPKYCDLIPLPKQIYKRMLPDLVKQAKNWVEKNKKLPNAIVHL